MLTVGMTTYNDYDGVYFTVQAIRAFHDIPDMEIIVIDNYGCKHTKAFIEEWAHAKYVLYTDIQGTAVPRNEIFKHATNDYVLVCDSHVLFMSDSIKRLCEYYSDNPYTRDLLQGPMVYDDFCTMSTHMEPIWREQFFGIWATDERGLLADNEPFEIPMQGMGAFSCRRDAWLGFNTQCRGFGGEEGYIHEKFRQSGNKCLCLPFLRWMHRFGRPRGIPYHISVEDKFRNYLICHKELGLDLIPVIQHFTEHLPERTIVRIARDYM